jgi:trimethylamine--corrinoid protein Co-methyltransferase
VGPRGHFLTQKSTQENLRKLWDPGITHQWSPENRDFKDPQEVAVEKIEWILKNHKPKPLDEKVKKEMSKIIKSAEDDLSKGGVN